MIDNISKKSISVIIPMYNSEKTIIRALESIRNQTAFDYIKEIIIVNDGSIDDSRNMVSAYMKKFANLKIELVDKVNGGVSSARNLGMKCANGDWFALLDSDDEWLDNKIEIQVEIIKEHPQIDFLGGSIDNSDLRILGRKINQLYKAKLNDLCIKVFPQTSTALFRRKIYDDIGGYDENQRYGEDANYFMKICYAYNYYYLPKRLVVYDGGKPSFGYSGLSSNLKGMQDGVMKNIRELRSKKLISPLFYYFLLVFNNIKYVRRVLIVRIANIKRKFKEENELI